MTIRTLLYGVCYFVVFVLLLSAAMAILSVAVNGFEVVAVLSGGLTGAAVLAWRRVRHVRSAHRAVAPHHAL